MRRALTAALLAATLVACGGSGDDGERAGPEGRERSALVGRSDGDGGGGGEGGGDRSGPDGTQSATGGGGTATTQAGPPPTTGTTKPRRPVSAKLDKTCVRKGANGDEQGITVNTDPGDTVAFSTEYSDHSNELTNQTYKSGSGHGEANADGVFRATWKIPDTAPDGEATVHFIAQSKIQEIKLKFTVVGPVGICP